MQRAVRQISGTLLTIVSSLIGFCGSASAQGVRMEVTDHVTNSRITGWEHELTDRDPNLSHWHWEPIGASSHQRNVRRITDPSGSAPETHEYVKTHYIKPIHVALPTVAHNNGSSEANANGSSDVSGRILKKKHGSAVIAQSKAVATYADYARGASAKDGYSSAVKTQVAGNIVHVSGRRTSYNDSPKTF